MGHLTSGVKPAPSTTLVTLLAVGAGLAVAGIYYNQPMLGALAASSLHATPAGIGFIPTATQLGYGGGILLLAPLRRPVRSPAGWCW